MFKGKIDIKVIFILILAGALILSFIFRPSKSIDSYKDKIHQLRQENDSLLFNNDSLKTANIKLNSEIKKILIDINLTKVKLDKTNKKLKNLENGKSKVSGYVNKLNADGIAKSLSEYLNRSKK
jgi:predicted nuclease with TOPRIM domain